MTPEQIERFRPHTDRLTAMMNEICASIEDAIDDGVPSDITMTMVAVAVSTFCRKIGVRLDQVAEIVRRGEELPLPSGSVS